MAGNLGVRIAFLALVKVRAGGTVEAVAREDLSRASCTLLYELWGVSIVKMPQNHHGRMLRSADMVELVVITLAEIEECLAIVQEFTIEFFFVIVEDLYQSPFAILH
jgi:hypothetical protein